MQVKDRHPPRGLGTYSNDRPPELLASSSVSGLNRIGDMRLTAIAARKALTRVATSKVAMAVVCCGCVAFTTSTVPSAHAADVNYQLI